MTATATAVPAHPVRAVLFDVDDTLYRVADLVRRCWTAAGEELARHGVCPDALFTVYARQLTSGAYEDVLERTLAACGYAASLAPLLRRIGQGPVPERLPIFDGVVGMLHALRQAGRACGVVTNGSPERQHAKLAALGIDDLVDVVVCAGEAVPAKPSPQPFLLACRELGVSPTQVLYVGDRPDFDVAPAVRLGMRAIRLVQGNHAGRPSNGLALLETPSFEQAWATVLTVAGAAEARPCVHGLKRSVPAAATA